MSTHVVFHLHKIQIPCFRTGNSGNRHCMASLFECSNGTDSGLGVVVDQVSIELLSAKTLYCDKTFQNALLCDGVMGDCVPR
jgi:hypothetical protein